MQTKIYKNSDGSDLTLDKVMTILGRGNYIEAIKTYRTIHGSMLKESKDAIDNNCAYKNALGQMTIDYSRSVRYFEKFFKPSSDGLLEALECAVENWEVLGYDTPVLACQAVLNNFGAPVYSPAFKTKG